MFEKFTTKDGHPITINTDEVQYVVLDNGNTIIGMAGNVNIALEEEYLEVSGRLIAASNN